jgi:hypothetical protein
VSQLLAVVSFVVCASLLLWLHLSKKYKDLSFLAISPETENQPEEAGDENPDQQN